RSRRTRCSRRSRGTPIGRGSFGWVVREPSGSPRDLEDAAGQFELLRRRLFGIAYRMLGSAAEAEDIVQDVWLRWQRYDRGVVANPEAFLVTTTTRLAINASQLARVRRE